VIFKLSDRFKINTFNIIVINYIVAALLGYSINQSPLSPNQIFSGNWLYLAVLIGILFIIMFYFIGLSSQKAGISVTTVASKMSVIIPIAFSIAYYNESIGFLKISGIIIAIIAVILTVYKGKIESKSNQNILLPIILFVGLGIGDSLVKFAQQEFVSNELSSIFTAILFTISGIIGILASFFSKTTLRNFKDYRVYLVGILLGITNFGSIYFLINALNSKILDSSVIFGINNIGIVALSIFIGFIIFKEKLSLINWIGIMLSLGALIILSNA